MDARREEFAMAYVECGEAKAAALAAGYAESFARSRSYELLRDPEVKGLIEEIERTGLPPEHLIPAAVTRRKAKEVLSAMALATPEHFLDEEGGFSLEKAGVFKYAVKEIVIDERPDGMKRVKVKLWDRLRALRELVKMEDAEEVASMALLEKLGVQVRQGEGGRCRVSGARKGGGAGTTRDHERPQSVSESEENRSDRSDRTDQSIRQGTDRSTHLSTEGVGRSTLKSAVNTDSEVGGEVHLSVGALPQEKRCGLPRRERRKLELAERRAKKKAAKKAGRQTER